MYWKKAHRSNKFVFTISSIWIIKTWNKSGYKYGNKYKVEKNVDIGNKGKICRTSQDSHVPSDIMLKGSMMSNLAIKQSWGKYS